MSCHRDDIDDATGLAGFDQMPDQALHCKERTAGICIEVPIPQLGSGFKKRAAISYSGRVHQAVDTTKMLDGLINCSVAVIWVRDIRFYK